jgi:hypothetical protein
VHEHPDSLDQQHTSRTETQFVMPRWVASRPLGATMSAITLRVVTTEINW